MTKTEQIDHLIDVILPADHPDILGALVGNHRRFLAFLEKRLGDRATAEEVLQNAFVKVVERESGFDSAEGAVTWFYRLLRNALTDHYRRRGTADRATEIVAYELQAQTDQELKSEICKCMDALIPTLRGEYAAILSEVDLKERDLKEVAAELGISTNNATVRLHRGRQALKKQLERSCGTCADHGCLNCSCENSSGCG